MLLHDPRYAAAAGPLPETEAPLQAPARARRTVGARGFWAAMGLQLLILAFLPSQKYAAAAVGRTMVVQTGAVDPYDPLTGRYADLSYPFARTGVVEELPGWTDALASEGQAIYFTMRPVQGPLKYGGVAPWQPVRVGATPPTLAPGDRVLAGSWHDGRVALGTERLHLEEVAGADVDSHLARYPRDTFAELRVDDQGRAVLVALRTGPVTY